MKIKEMPDIYTYDDIKALFNISRSSLERWEKAGNFPKRIHLGENKVCWLASEILNWVKEKARNR